MLCLCLTSSWVYMHSIAVLEIACICTQISFDPYACGIPRILLTAVVQNIYFELTESIIFRWKYGSYQVTIEIRFLTWARASH